ncbi:hypothetical protein AYP82_05510 [Lactobacillus crispatus]|uniref:Type I restriction modification DNA specificity domain-containing protein n=1 Tax=Lactobacillus crispatus TaxID=47770 RepID=A0A854PTI2_9LACO|nr:restriction endonuclease subunit S [Lactobacillus crispatus]OXC23906.1 hypothetical protein AYP82_05510 [Lactobacillus crispatus]
MIYKLKDLVNINYGKDHKKISNGNIPVYGTGGLMRYVDKYIYDGNSVLIPRKGSLNNVKFVQGKFWTVDTMFWTKINSEIVLPKYLYYCISKINLAALNVGSAVPSLTVKILNELQFNIPNIDEQQKIINKIAPIEAKIILNNQINDNLDALLTTIFEEKVKNSGFDEAKLTDIANYKNGLAMQKYRPKNNESSLPVLKIKELNQGYTDNSSDRCSTNIDKGVIVNQGDIIFSWSGTLLVKNWSGKTAGLNQHLFKVTSNQYPDWFIYEWTKHYLKKFQLIASGKATTLGHIKRNDLKSSKVFIPNKDTLNEYNTQLKPLYDKRIAIIKETQCLNDLKQTLLQKYF